MDWWTLVAVLVGEALIFAAGWACGAKAELRRFRGRF